MELLSSLHLYSDKAENPGKRTLKRHKVLDEVQNVHGNMEVYMLRDNGNVWMFIVRLIHIKYKCKDICIESIVHKITIKKKGKIVKGRKRVYL